MAEKRRVSVSQEDDAKEPEQAPPSPDGRGWRRWAREELALYWYVLGSFVLDAFIPLELDYLQPGGLGAAIGLVCLGALVPLEYWAYRKYFPRKKDEDD